MRASAGPGCQVQSFRSPASARCTRGPKRSPIPRSKAGSFENHRELTASVSVSSGGPNQNSMTSAGSLAAGIGFMRVSLQLLPQEAEFERLQIGALRIVGRAAMAAFDVLVVQHVVALRQHL